VVGFGRSAVGRVIGAILGEYDQVLTPLCATAMVHRREIDGKAVVFGNQGALWGRAMTWWDHDTGSIWSQVLREAIAGALKGERLEPIPSTLTEWRTWVGEHPGTLALDAPGGRSGFALGDMVIAVDLWAVLGHLLAIRKHRGGGTSRHHGVGDRPLAGHDPRARRS
jgi:hypothetical protein